MPAGLSIGKAYLSIPDKFILMATEATLEYIELMRKMTDVIAHDIRNPLNNILLSTAQFKLGNLPDKEDTAFYVDIIERNCDRIHDLLAEISATIHMQGLTPDTFDITELIREVVTEKVEALELKHIRCLTDLNEVIVARFDRDKMKPVLAHLLENAMDAIKGQGTIYIKAWEEEDDMYIRVQDSGHGIGQEVLPHIFAPFFTTRDRHRGLGLTLVKNTVEAHQGKVSVTTGDQGSCFTLQLPLHVD